MKFNLFIIIFLFVNTRYFRILTKVYHISKKEKRLSNNYYKKTLRKILLYAKKRNLKIKKIYIGKNLRK